MAIRDLSGQRFGRIAVIKFSFVKGRKAWWICKCDCGTIKDIRSDNLTCGETLSCGCLSREKSAEVGHRNATHGKSRTPTHNVWKQMKQRCENPHNHAFANYGGRGINVCDEWISIINFDSWALISGYKEGLTIERIDVNGNYCPENCTWIPKSEQNNNKRNSIKITFRGEIKTAAQWGHILGIKIYKIYYYLKKGKTVEEIIKICNKEVVG
jgi:hypothetical protein